MVAVIYMISLRVSRGPIARRTAVALFHLQRTMSAVATRPAVFPREYCGRKLDFRNNWEMGAAILTCGAIVFGLSFGSLVFGDFVWN